jgi:hypothetical protein
MGSFELGTMTAKTRSLQPANVKIEQARSLQGRTVLPLAVATVDFL